VLGLADRRQAVGGQLDAVAARQEQPAHAVLVDHVAGVDVARQLQVDRLAPRALDLVGPDHVAGVVVGLNLAGR
jgi:hypothetical protein